MTLERRLREQLKAAGADLQEPVDRLDRVVQRGRRRRLLQNTALGLAGVAVVLAAGAGWRAVTTTRVAFEPGATPMATVTADAASPTAIPTPLSNPSPTAQPTPDATADPRPAIPTVRIADLGTPVLAYRPGGSRLTLYRDGEELPVWSGRVEGVTGDGGGGVIVQSDRRLVWIADLDAPDPSTIVEADTPVTLRGMLADGRVLYSTLQDAKDATDSSEHFFAMPLASGAEPELITTELAYESWMIGPATTADGDMVMASCHTVCSLYPWPDEDDSAPFTEPVYNGGGELQGAIAAIDAIDATPDGTVLALAEDVPAEGIASPEVALLDASSMKQLARIPLPLSKNDSWAAFTISVSPNGQRVLVTMRPATSEAEAGGAVAVPRRVFLIEEALTDSPRTSRVDFTGGVLQWLDQPGGRY